MANNNNCQSSGSKDAKRRPSKRQQVTYVTQTGGGRAPQVPYSSIGFRQHGQVDSSGAVDPRYPGQAQYAAAGKSSDTWVPTDARSTATQPTRDNDSAKAWPAKDEYSPSQSNVGLSGIQAQSFHNVMSGANGGQSAAYDTYGAGNWHTPATYVPHADYSCWHGYPRAQCPHDSCRNPQY